MKRKMFVGMLVIVTALILLMAGCGCQHQWLAATCSAPQTCQLCGETEGETLPHTWQDATCSSPKTCTVCKAVEGELLPHTWLDASCTTPRTCSACKTTEGEALGHTWRDATCTTPKTCSVCQATEGEKADHTWQDATCIVPKTCSVCKASEGELADHDWTGATCTKAGVCSVCGAEGERANHAWTGATCTSAGVCSSCGATGSKADHSYVVLEDRKASGTFAGYRVKKCSTCERQKSEYYTESYIYDLNAIAAELAAYAKEKGFKPVVEVFSDYERKVAYGVWELELPGYGPNRLVQSAKAIIDYTYSGLTANGAILGNRAIHIHVYYTQSGAVGGGFFGVYTKTSFYDIE